MMKWEIEKLLGLFSWNGITDGLLSDYRKTVFLAVASIVVVLGVKKIISIKTHKNRRVKKSANTANATEKALATLEERKPANLWNTAMFFPDYHADEPDSTTQQFLWYFQQARTSIRVCIYNFSFPELEYVICQQYERGLIVQFILGQEVSAENLRRRSIPCGIYPRDSKVPLTDQLMHHKFALIDDEAVLAGSMNWTTEGIVNNNENICVSTNQTHVQKYTEEFNRLMSICVEAKTYY